MIAAALFLQMLSCLLNPPTPFLSSADGGAGKWLAEAKWAQFQTVEGRDLWVGYEAGGWDTAGDEIRRYTLRGEGYEVWVYYSPSRRDYEVYPFANTELFADVNNNHYGLHPCGGWAVNENIIDTIMNNGSWIKP